MENQELNSFIKLWITVIICLIYSYFIPTKIPKGILRLLSILPIVSIFTLLPLNLSTVNLSGPTAFFIAWLGNFKLLLLAFDKGPLSSQFSLSLPLFISVACLPIKIKQTPSPQTAPKSSLPHPIKVLLFSVLIYMYTYKHLMHPTVLLLIYGIHTYFALEILLVVSTAFAEAVMGRKLEPPFDEPYLSTSLQDFWGKRWNLMVTDILRPSVYDPLRCVLKDRIGKRGATMVGVMGTFVASGVMHELMYFYMNHTWPTGEVMSFFVLHGVCLVLEIMVKKGINGRWRLHPVVSGVLTISFMMLTGFWLFFPQLIRTGVDVRCLHEYDVVFQFGKRLWRNVLDYALKFRN